MVGADFSSGSPSVVKMLVLVEEASSGSQTLWKTSCGRRKVGQTILIFCRRKLKGMERETVTLF